MEWVTDGLSRLLVHRPGRRGRTTDRLYRAFDRSPEPADLRRRTSFRIIFPRAFAVAERHQEIGTIGDLAAPDRCPELGQRFTRYGDDRAFRVVAAGRSAVEHDGIGFARGAAGQNGFLHGVDVEYARTRRDDHHGGGLDGILHHSRQIGGRIDEDPLEALALRGGDDPADRIDCGLDLRLVGVPDRGPPWQAALRV